MQRNGRRSIWVAIKLCSHALVQAGVDVIGLAAGHKVFTEIAWHTEVDASDYIFQSDSPGMEKDP